MSNASFPAGFTGQARLFPLPNLVFFPYVMQPLHIFEPRYRQMTVDALQGDRFIALVLPLPGWEKNYQGKPAIHPIACIGQILAEHCLEDGCFNILLRGQARIRILEELPTDKLYRIARTEIIHDTLLPDAGEELCWRQTLIRKAPAWFPNQGEVVEQLCRLLQGELPIGTLCDIITFSLPLDAEFKQTLLAELDVATRLQRLHDWLDARQQHAAQQPRKFPTEFSLN